MFKLGRRNRYLDDSSSSDSSVTTMGSRGGSRGRRVADGTTTANDKNQIDHDNGVADDGNEDDELRSVDLSKWMKETTTKTKGAELQQGKNKDDMRKPNDHQQEESSKTKTSSSLHEDTTVNNNNDERKRKLSSLIGSSDLNGRSNHTSNKLPIKPISTITNRMNRHDSRASKKSKSHRSSPCSGLSLKKPGCTTTVKSFSLPVKERITSPATETLNDLTQMNNKSSENNGKDLRFDFSQLSQLTSYDTDDNDTDDNANVTQTKKKQCSRDTTQGSSSCSIVPSTSVATTTNNTGAISSLKRRIQQNNSTKDTKINSSINVENDHMLSSSQVSYLPLTQQSNNNGYNKYEYDTDDTDTDDYHKCISSQHPTGKRGSKQAKQVSISTSVKKQKSVIYYKSRCIYLGMYTEAVGNQKRQDANAKIREWTSKRKPSEHPSYDWVMKELECLQIRQVDSRRVGKKFYCVNYQNDKIDLGYFTEIEGKQKIQKAMQFIKDISQSKKQAPTVEWMKAEMERVGISATTSLLPPGHQSMTKQTFLKISLPEQGAIGMYIIDEDGRDYCVVRSLDECGQAKRYGVELDDEIFFIPDNNGSSDLYHVEEHQNLKGISSNQMQSLSQSSKRPINFLVRRYDKRNDKSSQLNAPVLNEANDLDKHPSELSNLLTKKEIGVALKYNQFATLPFCRRCNDESNISVSHHYLCSKNANFNDSGAKDKLVLVIAGIRDGCIACMYEYKYGKKSKNLRHNEKCGRPNNFKRSSTQIQEDGTRSTNTPIHNEQKNIEQRKEKGATSQNNKIDTSGKRETNHQSNDIASKSKSNISETSNINMKSKIAGIEKKNHADKSKNKMNLQLKNTPQKLSTCKEDMNAQLGKSMKKNIMVDVSRKKNQQINAASSKLTLERVKKAFSIEKSPEYRSEKNNLSDKSDRKTNQQSQSNTTETTPKAIRNRSSNDGNIKPVTPISPLIRNNATMLDGVKNETSRYQNNVIPSVKLTDDSEPVWVSCPNPWGDRAHEFGDFVLMSPSCYKLAHEVQGKHPKRFVMNPFDSDTSEYHRSHKSPSNGCSVLELKRDPLALRSWGFTFALHDFGGACLVTSVEPYSPAIDARDIGQLEQSTPLNVNDMILCVNGRKVGGMTELDLELELDMCGKEVILIVAKATPMRNKSFGNHENVWSHVESTRIQWCEVGNEDHYNAVEGKDEMCSVQGEDDNKTIEGLYQISLVNSNDSDDRGKQDQSLEQGATGTAVRHLKTLIRKNQKVDNLDPCPTSAECSTYADDENNPVQHSRNLKDDNKKHSIADLVHDFLPTSLDNSNDMISKNDFTHCEDEQQDHEKYELKAVHPASLDHGAAFALLEVSTSTESNCLSTPIEYETTMVDKDKSEETPSSKGPDINSEGISSTRMIVRKPPTLTKDKCFSQDSKESEIEEEEWEDDENPWLGCICGVTHESPIPVFWIQCDSCDAWYNCMAECIGFTKEEAKLKDDWTCSDCSPSDVSPICKIVSKSPKGNKMLMETGLNSFIKNVSPTWQERHYQKSCRKKDGKSLQITPLSNGKFSPPIDPPLQEPNEAKDELKKIYEVGTIVNVEDRTWVGSNKPGGIAKIINVQVEGKETGDISYDVQYVLESRKEFGVDAEFISIDSRVVPGFSSPSDSTRSQSVRKSN